MTKTKRIILILSFFFVFAVMTFAVPASVAYAYAEGEEVEQIEEQPSEEKDWAAWVKETLVPAVVLVVSGALTIYIAISPILVKVKKAKRLCKLPKHYQKSNRYEYGFGICENRPT